MMEKAVQSAWEAALTLWGVRLKAPVIYTETGLVAGSFAWFTFPPEVSLDIDKAAADGALPHLTSVFAHEIGHHVVAPGTRITGIKVTHQIARGLAASGLALPLVGEFAPVMSNLWADLLINERVVTMQRRTGPPDMIELWRTLTAKPDQVSPMWWVVLRAYEIRWELAPGVFCDAVPPEASPPSNTDPDAAVNRTIEALAAELATLTYMDPRVDARLLAELIAAYTTDPVSGALPFAVLMAPYVDAEVGSLGMRAVYRTQIGGLCSGNHDERPVSPGELEEVLGDRRLRETPWHPALAGHRLGQAQTPLTGSSPAQGYGLAQTLELYAASDADAVLSAWYQAQARPYIRPLDQVDEMPARAVTVPGPSRTWQLGDDIVDLDWSATLVRGVTVVPGVTTQARSWLPDDPLPHRQPIELDLYLDSSGSMGNPRRESPAVLAATILIGSVLLANGRVRVTSFSGPGQVSGTPSFTRNRTEVMAALTSYFGGGTTFPLDLLAQRYRHRSSGRGLHLVVLSDDGLQSMFGAGQREYADVAARARTRCRDATLVLIGVSSRVDEAAQSAGYHVEHVASAESVPQVCARLARRITNLPIGGVKEVGHHGV